jgi:DNA-binding transcriptional ArsR family regulator
MEDVLTYLEEVLGIRITPVPMGKSALGQLPVYINESYELYNVNIFNRDVVFAAPKSEVGFRVLQTDKQVLQIRSRLNKTVVLVLKNIQAFNRNRLVQKGVNFIVASKQLYLPDLLIDLRENYHRQDVNQRAKGLLPSAQLLLIFRILSSYSSWNIEEHSFKDIAEKFGYTPMTISNAIENLKNHGLLDVIGEKEKFIRFRYDKKVLWDKAKDSNLLTNPILKTVFVDEVPRDLELLISDASALPVFTDLNPGSQQYYAIDKDQFYELQKNNGLVNANPYEGKYALEVWKYKPLSMVSESTAVDPLSLYLSFENNSDERIEMALDQILSKYLW